MKRNINAYIVSYNILTYFATYLVALVISVIICFMGMVCEIDDGIFIILFFLWMVTFFFAGRRFIKPTGDKRVDLAVFYPGVILFVIFNICFIYSVKKEYGSFKMYIAKMGLEDIILIFFIIVSASLFASFFLWLGMISKKKKFFKRNEYEESDKWNNEW